MAEQSTGRPAFACARASAIAAGRDARVPRRRALVRARAASGRWLCTRGALGALCLIAQLTCASGARAEPELALSWDVPSACPDAAWARQRIAAQLAREPAAEVAQGVRASVTVEPRASGFALHLRTVVAGASGERTLQADACEELAQAAALIIALSVSEASERAAAPNPPEPPAPPARTPPPMEAATPRESLLALRADLLLDYGFFEGLGVGPAFALAYQYGIFRAELSALWIKPRTMSADAPVVGSVESSLWALRVGSCALFESGRVHGGPCAGGEFGQTRGVGMGDLESASTQRQLWIAGFLGARVGVRLIAKLALVVQADMNVLVAGPSYVTKPADGSTETLPIHAPAPVQLRANLGVELRF